MFKGTVRPRLTIIRGYRAIVASLVPGILAIIYAGIPQTVWQMVVPRAQAASFVVTNTNDAGTGSLRQAILNANVDPISDSIVFNIPPTDPRHFYYLNNGVAGTVSRSMISVTSAADDAQIADIDPDWPHSWFSIETTGFVGFATGQTGIGTPVTIDGFSQPGSVPNTSEAGSLNSVLKIEVTNNATDLSCSRIFHIAFEPVVVKGLIMNGCGVNGSSKLIDFDFASTGSVAAGNYLGTDPSGTVALGSGYGVHIVQASGVRVGGNSSADRNLISGNFHGVTANSGGASHASFSGTAIIGNLIGTKRDGISPLGNGFHPQQPLSPEDGIVIIAPNGSTSDNRIENNVIAFNSRHAINVATGGVGTGTSTIRNRFLRNSIHSNGNTGIQLEGNEQAGSFVTRNDACDADDGVNNLQNYPVIKGAVISGNIVSIAGTLDSTPGGTYDIEFFASSTADGTYFGEGQTFLGTSTVVIPGGACIGTFNVSLPLPAGAGNAITATATDANDNTSEFSAVYFAQPPSNSCTVRPAGIVSWYSAQGNVNDSQSDNHGRFRIAPKYNAGKVGHAFDLRGPNTFDVDVIDVPDHSSLDLANAFTIEMWVSPAEVGLNTGQSFFLSKGNMNNVHTQSYGIMFTPDRRIVNRVGNGTAIDQLVSSSVIPLNQFTHIATTYDGSTLRVYVNGLLDSSATTTIGSLLNTSDPLVIGGAVVDFRIGAVAAIDEPSLYNRALSDIEIAAIHGAGSAGKCENVTAPPTPTPTPTPTPSQGTVVINLDAIPDDPQDFSFDIAQSFSLDDDSDPTLPSSRQFEMASGGHVFRMQGETGWVISQISCIDPDNGSGTVTGIEAVVDLDPGETVTCTFTVTKQQGTVVINLDAVPDDPQDFTFDIPQAFSLDDDDDPTLPSFRQFVLPSGTRAFRLPGEAGWAITQISCIDPDNGTTTSLIAHDAVIDLDTGETVTCTFTVTRQQGTVVINLDAVPDGPRDFGFSSTGGPGLVILPFSLDDDADGTLPSSMTFDNLAPGSYGFTQTVPVGWDLTGLSCADPDSGSITNLATATATVDVDAGETVTCTFTDTFTPPPPPGTIVINLDALPASQQDFGFTSTGGPASGGGPGLMILPFSLDDDDDGTLPSSMTLGPLTPGNYGFTQTVPVGWDLTGLSCADPDSGSSTNLTTATVTIDVDAGEVVTCTFTNRARPGIIRIVMDAVPDAKRDFLFTGSGGVPDFVLDDDDSFRNSSATPSQRTFGNLTTGEYHIRENAPSGGFHLTGLTCDDPDGGSTVSIPDRRAIIDLDPGETVVCTFTNSLTTVIIVKDAVPDTTRDFFFTGSGNIPDFVLDDDSTLKNPSGLSNQQEFAGIEPGEYRVQEAVVGGWLLIGLSCADPDGGSTVSLLDRRAIIDLDPGETVVCTFTSTRFGGP